MKAASHDRSPSVDGGARREREAGGGDAPAGDSTTPPRVSVLLLEDDAGGLQRVSDNLATGYELDIIASAVMAGASLSGGRGSVLGAVLGTLIFGVLRNALPQIPGATFYDRLIVGLVVIVIIVMDQLLARRGK
ncbi:MAG TPA: hypothetical protein VGJ61_09550 [Solirubrobacterales bacterium]